jgi:hypothetical protein
MIEFLVALSITSIWITLGCLAVLFALRILAVVMARKPWRTSLLVLFLPFSLGYYRLLPERTTLSRVYGALVGVTVLFSLLASFWVFYVHFA